VPRQAGSGDEVAYLARDLFALGVGGVLAGALDDGRQELAGAVGPGQLDGFEDLPRDGSPGVGAAGGGQPPPVGQGATLDRREDALEGPGLDGVIDGGGDVPELQRAHEIESARIARIELERLAISGIDIDRVVAIIDGHDTRPQAQSLEDALMKDADKLWRFTAHGIATLCVWFGTPAKETVAMLESFVLPKLITETGRTMAQALLADGVAAAWMEDTLALQSTSNA